MITNKDKLRQAVQHVHMTGEMDVEDEEWLESLVNQFEEYEKALKDINECNGVLDIYDASTRAGSVLY